MAKRAVKITKSYELPEYTEIEVYAISSSGTYRVFMTMADWMHFNKVGRVGNLQKRAGWRYTAHQKGHGAYPNVIDYEFKK